MPNKFLSLDDSRLNNLTKVFHELFREAYRTCLKGGGSEPLYRPASSAEGLHTIEFSYDYFSSALHEIAHWCIAGPERLEKLDYGYWYAPDGRSESQQAEFEMVEVKPQALERILSFASCQRFRISADNLTSREGPSEAFKIAVHQQTLSYCRDGLPERAGALVLALAEAFDSSSPCDSKNYLAEDLV